MTPARRLVILVNRLTKLAIGNSDRRTKVNPIWTKLIIDAVGNSMKKCPHCKKVEAYPRKRPGQFHTCKRCGHRFKEKGE
jgi:phage FluMu protein Com